MMFHCIASGSAGNAYALKFRSGETLLLDAGVTVDKLQRQFMDDWRSLRGVLVTHEHKDHCKGVEGLLKVGVPVYASRGTREAIHLPAIRTAVAGQAFTINGTRGVFAYIVPFHVRHDAAEPMGFLIQDAATGERFFYATDFACKTEEDFKRYKIQCVHYWLIECNYVDWLVDPDDERDQRRIRCHMGLTPLERILAGNDMATARQIILCHLSNTAADEAEMIRRISELTGVPTVTADKGLKVRLELAPF